MRAHNLQLHITTDEEAAASKRMFFFTIFTYFSAKNNIYLVSLSRKKYVYLQVVSVSHCKVVNVKAV